MFICMISQGSVLTPFVFAVYIDDICRLQHNHANVFAVLYADDILLLAPSVIVLKKLLWVCRNWILYACQLTPKSVLYEDRRTTWEVMFKNKDTGWTGARVGRWNPLSGCIHCEPWNLNVPFTTLKDFSTVLQIVFLLKQVDWPLRRL